MFGIYNEKDLFQILKNRFNDDELRTLCFELDIKYGDLGGETTTGKARELAAYCERFGRLPELADKILAERPNAFEPILLPDEITEVVTAAKGAVEKFDLVAGPVMAVLDRRPKDLEDAGAAWRHKIYPEGMEIVVKQQERTIQIVTADRLAQVLSPEDLELVKTYEANMNRYFARWKEVYAKRDTSKNPRVNADNEKQLTELIVKMKAELLGILTFLDRCGVYLDDHYQRVRHLVEQLRIEA